MRQLLLIAAVSALALARPEQYRETEDFQYSRSSSDEGSKSGYYGAQRGNMGGNFEKAHNMDSLAQHQMGSLVNQVQGELGDASKSRAGNVFTSSSSRGMYGTGHFDTSNLQGRNFQEGTSYGGSDLSSSSDYQGQTSSSHSAGYSNSRSHNSRYSSTSGQLFGSDNLQRLDNGGVNYGYGSQGHRAGNQYDYGAQSTNGFSSQSGFEGQQAYDSSSSLHQHADSFGTAGQSRLVHRGPVRVIMRPGTYVSVPVATQSLSQSTSDQSAVNTDAEVFSNSNGNHNTHSRQNPNSKHYESSFSYSKQWEKHDTKPTGDALPLGIPTNSELYDNSQAANSYDAQYQTRGSSSHNSRHSSNIYSSRNEAQRQSDYNQQQHSSTSASGSNSQAFTHGIYNANTGTHAVDLNSILENDKSNPKSYQSSYSYHKSWERQGDPYVIVPGSDGQASQRLSSLSANQRGLSSHQFGSQTTKSRQRYSHNSDTEVDCDCDENGQPRVRRHVTQHENQMHEYTNEMVSNHNYEQSPSQSMEHFGQQTQNTWNDFTGYQHTENFEKLETPQSNSQSKFEDLGQQTQDDWSSFLGQNQQHSWGKLDESQTKPKTEISEDFGQQTQDDWSSFSGQQQQQPWGKLQSPDSHTKPKPEKLEDLGQQTQDDWSSFSGKQQQQPWGNLQSPDSHTKPKPEKLEDLGQQTQDDWSSFSGQQQQQPWGNLQSPDSHTKPKPEKPEDLSQQTQDDWSSFSGRQQQPWGNLQSPDSHTEPKPEKLEDLGQQTQNDWSSFSGQQQQPWGKLDHSESHTKPKTEIVEDLGQQTQDVWSSFSGQQQQQQPWGKLQSPDSHTKLKPETPEDLGQQTQDDWSSFSGQQQQQPWGKLQSPDSHTKPKPEKLEDLGQQTQDDWSSFSGQQQQQPWGKLQSPDSHTKPKPEKLEDLGQQTQDDWSSFSGQQQQQPWGKLQSPDSHTKPQPEKLEDLGQKTQDDWSSFSGQQQQQPWGKLQSPDSHTKPKPETPEDLGQKTQDDWSSYSGQQQQQTWGKIDNSESHTNPKTEKVEDLGQQSQGAWSSFSNSYHAFPRSKKLNQHQGDWTMFIAHHRDENQYQNDKNNGQQWQSWNTHHSWNVPQQNHAETLGNYDGNTFNQRDMRLNHEQRLRQHVDSYQSNYNQQSHTQYNQNSNGDSDGLTKIWDMFDTLEKKSFINTNNQPSEPSVNNIDSTSADSKRGDINDDDNQDSKYPADIGRGDIENAGIATSLRNNSQHEASQIYVSNTEHKQYRNPKEIDALSLTSVTQSSTSTENSRMAWFEEQKQKWEHTNINTKPSPTTTPNIKLFEDQSTEEKLQDHQEVDNLGQQCETSWGEDFMQDTQSTYETSSLTKENKPLSVQQTPSNSDNGQAKLLVKDKLSRTTVTSDTDKQQLHHSIESTPEVIDDQMTEQKEEDYAQQARQNIWDQNTDFQQSETWDNVQQNQQPIEHFQQDQSLQDSSNLQQSVQDSQNLRVLGKDETQRGIESELHSNKYLQSQSQPLPDNTPKDAVTEVITPTEVTTQKPGFWKSIGNKFTSAKNNVKNYFGYGS